MKVYIHYWAEAPARYNVVIDGPRVQELLETFYCAVSPEEARAKAFAFANGYILALTKMTQGVMYPPVVPTICYEEIKDAP